MNYTMGKASLGQRLRILFCHHEWLYRNHPNGYFCNKCDAYIQNEGIPWGKLPGFKFGNLVISFRRVKP